MEEKNDINNMNPLTRLGWGSKCIAGNMDLVQVQGLKSTPNTPSSS